MDSLKDNVAGMIRELPAETSLKEIQYHLYVLEKIQNGRESIRDGGGVSHADAKERLAQWLAD